MPDHPPPTSAPTSPRRSVNPRVALLLLALIVFISASVILTDYLSPRQRPAPPTTLQAKGNPQ